MLKSKLLDAVQKEIYRHDFGTLGDEPPLTSQGGKGALVAGCPACRKRLQSMNEFLDHAEDVKPKLLDRLSSGASLALSNSNSLAYLARETQYWARLYVSRGNRHDENDDLHPARRQVWPKAIGLCVGWDGR
jgi:hypothetical protein